MELPRKWKGDRIRAAIYARVGNPDQVAVRHQAEVLTGQIRGMWGERTEIDIYADNGISGLRTDRPGLQKLLRNAGTYNGVFVYNMSRLSRSVPDAVGLVRQLKNQGAELYAADRNMAGITEEILKAVSDIPT